MGNLGTISDSSSRCNPVEHTQNAAARNFPDPFFTQV